MIPSAFGRGVCAACFTVFSNRKIGIPDQTVTVLYPYGDAELDARLTLRN